MGAYFSCLGKYATFGGRASRAEFWGYNIVNAIIIAIMAYFYYNSQTELSHNIAIAVLIMYIIITTFPTLGVMSRRWHDIGRTGKWLWLNLVPVVGTVVTYGFMFVKGEEGTNEYGRNPLERRFRRRRR